MEDFKYDDQSNWFGQTTVHPIGLAIVIALAIATILLPRRWSFVPMIALACVVPTAQRVVIFDLDFDFPRLLIIAAVIRFALRSEFRGFEWNPIDRFLVAYVCIGVLAYVLLHQEEGAITYRLGWAFDAIGFYFVFRYMFLGHGDVKDVVRTLVVLSIPVAAVFIVEMSTHLNFFSVFGGVPPITWIRDGRLRCQGPFAHPIIAGCFWGSLLPIIGSTFFQGGKWRLMAIVGVVCALICILATNSSTSIMTVIFGAIGVLAYPLRKHMKVVRWTAVLLAVGLHLCMKKPVWHLLARVTVFDASTGWHRYHIIDLSVNHFGDWWLMGITDTNSWNEWDITNEYVFAGIESGFFGLLMFLGMIWSSFKRVGTERARVESNPADARLMWALGCAMFVHCTNYLGVSYFGQCKMVWYLLLALIASQGPRVAAAAAATRGAVAGPRRRAPSRASVRRFAPRTPPPAAPTPGDGSKPVSDGAKQP